jgi:hypothetical protein
VDGSISCSTTDTGRYDGTPICSTGVDANNVVWIKVQTLITQQFSYLIAIDGIVNPKSAKSVADVACHTCTDTSCSSFIESYDRIRLQFNSVNLLTSAITVSGDSLVNGAEEVTIKYDIVIGNPLPALGIVYLHVPK